MTEPTPVRCPAIEHPDVPPADPADLDPLLARLASSAPVVTDETFPLGTLRPDGRVDLCKQGLGPAGAARLLPAAAASPLAVHVLLGTNAIGGDGARAVADALVPGHGLETLYLGCNRIDASGAEMLARRLATDATVRALWLKRNPVGDAGVRALAAMLRRNTVIRTLDLVNTGLTRDGLRALLDVLAERPGPVERLFLGGNGLGPESADLLAALIKDAGVRELYLPANHLGDTGAAALAAAADPARPVRLGLGGNGLGPGAPARWPTPSAASRRWTSAARRPSGVSARPPTPPGTPARRYWPPRCQAAPCAGWNCGAPGSPVAAPRPCWPPSPRTPVWNMSGSVQVCPAG